MKAAKCDHFVAKSDWANEPNDNNTQVFYIFVLPPVIWDPTHQMIPLLISKYSTDIFYNYVTFLGE